MTGDRYDTLVCDNCGVVMGDAKDIEITDPEGRAMSIAEYNALLEMTGKVLYCEECQEALGLTERNHA